MLDFLNCFLRRDTSRICVCCGRRLPLSEMKYSEEYIGICTGCASALPAVPPPGGFGGSHNIDYIIACYYYENEIRSMLHRLKFKGEWRIGSLLAQLTADALRNMELEKEFDLMIPVPISRMRMNERGYNQSAVIASAAAERLGIPCCEDILFKTLNTTRQSSLDRSARLLNPINAYIADGRKLAGKSVLLFDDIITSGATTDSCAAELLRAGAERVCAMAFAYATRREENGKHIFTDGKSKLCR